MIFGSQSQQTSSNKATIMGVLSKAHPHPTNNVKHPLKRSQLRVNSMLHHEFRLGVCNIGRDCYVRTMTKPTQHQTCAVLGNHLPPEFAGSISPRLPVCLVSLVNDIWTHSCFKLRSWHQVKSFTSLVSFQHQESRAPRGPRGPRINFPCFLCSQELPLPPQKHKTRTYPLVN